MTELNILSKAVTDVGLVRDHNEDFALSAPDLGLHIVCDGMGGHAAGEVASKMAAESIVKSVREQQGMVDAVRAGTAPNTALAEMLRAAIERANQEVHALARSDREKRGMGTTCTAVIISNGVAVMGHVGDSQLHLIRQGVVSQLSEDHTFVAEAVRRGAMTAEQAAESEHGNILMRSIGTQESVSVDTLVFDVVVDDVLILCSDGLSQYLKAPQELVVMRGERSVEDYARNLLTVANARGGSDNTSVIVMQCNAPQNRPSLEPAMDRRRTVIDAMNALSHVEVMVGFSTQEMFTLRQVFHERQFAAGDCITQEGSHGEEMYVLLSGSARVIRGDDIIATLKPGSHFGEMALLNDRPRVASVVAIDDCQALVCARDALAAVLQQHTTLAARFYLSLARALSLRLRDVYSFYAIGREDDPQETGRTTMFHGS